jgi:hypothetical protein
MKGVFKVVISLVIYSCVVKAPETFTRIGGVKRHALNSRMETVGAIPG